MLAGKLLDVNEHSSLFSIPPGSAKYSFIHNAGFPGLLCILVLLGLVTGCDNFSKQAEERAKAAATDTKEILLAVVDSSSTKSLFIRGVALAIDEFNSKHAIRQELVAQYHDDLGKITKARSLARKLARDEDVDAVIGHLSSATARVASIVYERAGLVMITPGATQTDLIRRENKFIFRNIPSDDIFARETVRYIQRKQYKRVLIIYDQEHSTRSLAKLFHEAIDDANDAIGDDVDIEVTATRFYPSWEKDYRELIAKARKDVSFDALFLSGRLPQGAEMIKQLRAMEVSVPIIGSIEFDSLHLPDILGKAAKNTIIVTVFDPEHSNQVTRGFVRRFKAKYGKEPDTWAAQGYDAVGLLTEAIVEGKSHLPATVATTLRLGRNWQGAAGRYSMGLDGDVIEKDIFFKAVESKPSKPPTAPEPAAREPAVNTPDGKSGAEEIPSKAVASEPSKPSTAPEPAARKPAVDTPDGKNGAKVLPSKAVESKPSKPSTAPEPAAREPAVDTPDGKSGAEEIPSKAVASEPSEPSTAPEPAAREPAVDTPDGKSGAKGLPSKAVASESSEPSTALEPAARKPAVDTPDGKSGAEEIPSKAVASEPSEPSTALEPAARKPAVDTPDGKSGAEVCYRLGPVLEQTDINGVRAWLDARGITATSHSAQQEKITLHWVYLPPFQTRAEAEEQANRMRKDGIGDIYILSRGKMSNAISLGVFNKRSSVKRRLDQLGEKGYIATVGVQNRTKNITWFNAILPADTAFPAPDFGKRFLSLKVEPAGCVSPSKKP